MATTTDGPGPKVLGVARRTFGMALLLLVVVLWTASNFLGSTIFADKTYPKPFFVTYINTSLFTLPLFSTLITRTWGLWRSKKLSQIHSIRSWLRHLDSEDPKHEEQSMLRSESFDDDTGRDHEIDGSQYSRAKLDGDNAKLGLRATAKLSLEFCLLWFVANYFAMACLQFTTVGSTTILTSTSGVWTLVFGAIIGVERFTLRKFLGVVASLIGIILISRVDLSNPDAGDATSADNGGSSFPHKTPTEIAIGDAMAAFSSIMYGVYTIVMKKQVGDESRVNMPLFFGLVGFFNLVLLWPGFFVLHWTGVETFSLPDTQRVWTIILVNSLSSFISDIAWAYAMLLTTPLVVTVGLSLTIPLSLVGQMFLQAQYASPVYWLGAAIVFLSFLVVNHESQAQEEDGISGETSRPSSGEYDTIPGDEEMR